MVPDREITNKYLKEAYRNYLNDIHFLETENYKKLKEDSLKKFEIQLKGSLNIKQLRAERDSLRQQFEFLDKNKNELEDLQQEEQERMCKLAEAEKRANEYDRAFDEKFKFVKSEKKELIALREKLANAEKELASKDAEYDKQLAIQSTGNQMENLPVKHAQKVQELDNLQNTFIDIENKIDELHSKQIQKTSEIKRAIADANDLANKIMLSSALSLEKLPQLDILDLHTKRDIIKEYKDQINKIREKYISDVCKLPEQFSQVKVEKKMIDNRLEQSKNKKAQLESENKRFEFLLDNLQKESEEAIGLINRELNQLKKIFVDKEHTFKLAVERLAKEKTEYERLTNEQKKIESELENELKSSKKSMTETIAKYDKDLAEKENDAINYIKQVTAETREFKKELIDFNAKEKAEYTAYKLRFKTILANLKR